MGCIGRLDGDRSRALQAFDEVAVDVDFAAAAEPEAFGVRYQDRSVPPSRARLVPKFASRLRVF